MSACISDIEPDGCYFERAPERLVLEGYRRWIAGFDTGSVVPWELTFDLYSELLGPTDGRRVLGELSHFVRTLRQCALCPLRSFPFGAHHICQDECMAMGLIAGIQHQDDEAAQLCLGAVTCTLRQTVVGEAAASFAHSLSELDHLLLPIPSAVIRNILTRTKRGTIH